jgi:hypothetical protein
MKIRALILAIALSVAAPMCIGADATATPIAPPIFPPVLTSADMDGIWAIQNSTLVQQQAASYFSIRAAPSGILVLIRLGSGDWQAFVTTLNANSATVITMTTQAINTWKIDFASAEKATITGLLCISNGIGIQPLTATPSVGSASTTDVIGMPIRIGNQCFVPQGTVLNLMKVV